MSTDRQTHRDALVRVLALLRPHWRRVVAVLALGIAVILLTNALPQVTRYVIDDGFIVHNRSAAMSGLGLLVLVGAIRWVCDLARRNLSGAVGLHVETDLRTRLFTHLLALDTGWHGRTQAGQVLSRVSSDIRTVRMFLSFSALFIALNTVSAVTAFVQIWLLSPRAALCAALVMPLFAYVTVRYGRRVFAVSEDLQEQVGVLTTYAEENAAGIRVIKGLGREDGEIERFSRQAGLVRTRNLDLSHWQARYVPLTIGLPQFGLIIILWYGGYLAIHGSLTVGTLIALSTYMAMLVWPISSLVGLFATARRAAASAQRVFEVLDQQPAVTEHPAARPIPVTSRHRSPGARLTLDDLGFRYSHTDWPGLHGICFDIAAGEHAVIAGASGSGKSTLASLIVRLQPPTTGRILLDGHDIAQTSLDSLRRQIGFVPQDATLLHGSIRDNLLVGRPSASEADLDRSLHLAAAADLVRSLPQGLDTLVGEQGLMLSGGQRQRIALARALLIKPRLVVIDDALGQLDPLTEELVHDGLDSLRGDVTIVYLTRPPKPAAHNTLILDEGTILADVRTATAARSMR